jgi:glyoxylase-like metal-dependent hydrolase (beta-lactamase superfamily II)
MIIGDFDFTVYNHGYFRVDGGAMFGPVPKSVWSRRIAADADNRIRLATRSLMIRNGDRLFMVDTGNGDYWPERILSIYAMEPPPAGGPVLDPEAVTDVIISHLHIDHAGGIAARRAGDKTGLELRFPRARIHVQAENLANALNPNIREKAGYRKEYLGILEKAECVPAHGSREIHLGIWVHPSNGHTRGHQWVEVKAGRETVAFPADMIPTSHHIPIAYTMGFDIHAEQAMADKEDFLRRAVDGNWIVVFGHDPDIAAARLKIDGDGRYAAGDVVTL